jgi:CPA2 family monovalent cation:H+ antiporter-2
VEGYLFEFSLVMAVLGFAAAVSIFVRLPVVPLYIGAGLLISASGVPAPEDLVAFLGTLGVVFLLFAMGLEFSVASFGREKRSFLASGSIDWLINFPIGLLAGWLLGWSWSESLFLAGILYMSSSAVVAKCIAEFGRAARPETETILRVMVFEDLVIAVYLILLNALFTGAGGDSGWGLVLAQFLFIAFLVVAAQRYQEQLARLIASQSQEAFTLALFAFVVFVAAVAAVLGLSEAVGAFLAGMVIGSTELKTRAADTLLPFQTLFAALFFVSFGMSLDLSHLGAVLVPAVLLVLLGIASKTIGGYLAGRASGHPPRQAIVVGMSLVPKGEFSIVIASMAAATAGPDSPIVALTGLYVLALSIIGPIGMREADAIRDWLLPRKQP